MKNQIDAKVSGGLVLVPAHKQIDCRFENQYGKTSTGDTTVIFYGDDLYFDGQTLFARHIRTWREVKADDAGHCFFPENRGDRNFLNEFLFENSVRLDYCWGGYGVIVRDDEMVQPEFRMSGTRWFVFSKEQQQTLVAAYPAWLTTYNRKKASWEKVSSTNVGEVEVGRLTEIHTTDKGLNYLLIEEEKVFLPKSTDLGQYRIVEVLKRNELDAERSSKSAFLVGEPTMKRTDFEDLKTAVAEAADGLQGLWESIFRPNFPCRYTKDEKFLGLPHLYVDADRHFQSLVNHQQELYLPANIELATNILEAISLCESNLDLVGRKGFYLPSEWESNLRQPGWQIFIETLKAFGNPKAILGSFEYRANIGTREGAAWLASGIPAKGVATSITYKINKEEKIINLLDRGKFIVDGFVGEIIPLLTEAEIADLCAANGMSVINQSLTHGKGFDSDTVKFCLKKLSV